MDISKILDSGGYVHNNPEYNPKSKKGKLQPQFIVNADPNGAINRGSALADVMSQHGRQGKNLDYLGRPEKYAEYDVTISPVDESLDKELSEAQGAFSKFKNAIAQAAVSEVALGTAKGVSDFIDFISGAVFRGDNDYSNPVSQYLGQLQEDFKNWAPVYADPDKNISNGGLLDAGWWASNLPSIMSSLTLMIPSTGVVKGLGWVGRGLNAATNGKLGAFTRNAYKVMTGAGKAKTIEEAEKLNKVTRWLNDTNTIAAGQRMAETGLNAAIMRTMENYQEAHQVYDDMRTKALDKFNSMTDAEYAAFINQNADKLEGINVTDKEAVANILAKQSADRTFVMDYANTIFDIVQLNALRNPIKLLKNMRSSAVIEAAQKESMSAIGKAAAATTEKVAEEAGIKATASKLGSGVGKFLKDSSHTIKAELSEGVEEAINYIAQEEGMHYGNVALGEDVKNGFEARLSSYMNSPELYDSAFWGVLGGVVFQGLGSGFNRLSVAAERYNQQRKKKADDTTGEAVNTANFQELFESSESRRRIADINARQQNFNTLIERLNKIEPEDGSSGIDPYNTDENNNPIKLETEVEKSIAKERAIDDYITGMTFRAMDNGNFDMLKAYLQDSNIRQALEEATGNEGDNGAFVDSLVKRMDHIADRYSQNLIALSNISRNVNIASESVIPVEYLQIIARDNTAKQIQLENIDSRIGAYETSVANKTATYGNKLDKSLNYKDAVQLAVLTQQLATLRAKRAEIEKSEDKQGIGRQIELDRINENIRIVENMITGQGELSNSDALTRLIYSTIQSNQLNDKDAYASNLDALARGDVKSIIGEENAKKFETTDEELMKVLGADRTSGAYKTLATDIDAAFEGAYGLNKIDKRLGDDYVVLAALNIEKAVLNEDIIMNESGLQKRVNKLHNDMLDARKKAIADAENILRRLAKTYGRENMANHLETGNTITWNNENDRKSFDDALKILNMTSASNQQLYDDVQNMLMMDELIERSQEAANNTGNVEGESSTTSQNQNVAAQSQQPNNQSQQNGQTPTGQGNTLNPAQSGQGQQSQPQIQTPTPTTTPVIPPGATSVIDDYKIGDTKVHSIKWNNGNAELYNESGTRIGTSSMSAEVFEQHTGVKPATISSTGGQESKPFSPAFDKFGNPIVDTNRMAVEDEISKTLSNAVTTARDNRSNVIDAINNTVQQLNTKYGSDEGYKKHINRMANFVTKRAISKGLVKDLADLVILSSSVTEKGGEYYFSAEYLDAAKKFANDFLKDANAKKFDDKTVVSFESMLRFANEQMEDPSTAQYIYQSLKAWFEVGPEHNNYVVLDNMNSTSIFQRVSMTNKALVDSKLRGVNVYRIDIKDFLNRNASKAAIDKLNVGDKLNAKFADNGDVILMSSDVEVGRFPKPKVNSVGGYTKTNDGWITDVRQDNGTVVSNIKDIWRGILLDKSDINDKINSFIYQIIAARKINGNLQQINDAINNDSDLKTYFDNLKSQGYVDKNTKNSELIDGLVSIWNYIDLTTPIQEEREELINYSLDLWFNKLYHSYDVINSVNENNLNNLSFSVAKITDGDVNQAAPNNDNAYDLYNFGLDGYAFVNPEITEIGVIKDGNAGVIQTTSGNSVPQPNGSTGSFWAILPNRSGIPGIVSGHSTRFMDTNPLLNNTPAGRIRKAVKDEFKRRIKKYLSDATNKQAFNELIEFIELVYSNRGQNPLLTSVAGTKVSCRFENSTGTGTRYYKIGIKNLNKEFVNFTINNETLQYKAGNGTFKDITEENLDDFISSFESSVLDNSMFNADYGFFNSDEGVANINGICTRDKDNNFVITIPNSNGEPLVEKFPSFKAFMMQGGGAKWNIKIKNESNFMPRSKNQLRNQVLNISIEDNFSRPVEETVEESITPETVNNGTAIDTLIEQKFGKNSPAVKRLKDAGLIPSSLTYTKETLMKGNHPSNIWTSISTKKIYVNDEFIKTMNSNFDLALRKLIHEQLHVKLHSRGNQRKELLNRIQEIYNDFEKSLSREGVDEHLKDYLFGHIAYTKYDINDPNHKYTEEELEELAKNKTREERLEEFLVESLTNRELAGYLNTVDATAPTEKTKKSIFDKILELLSDIFGWNVTEGSLYEKELRVLQGFTEETQQVQEEPTVVKTEPVVKEETQQKVEKVEEPKEEKKSKRRFGRDDRVGSSVQEGITPSVSQFVETLSLEERVSFDKLLLDGTVSMKCS